MVKLLNYHEFLTNLSLGKVAKEYGAQVAPKVRVADVLPIQHSGISKRWFSFALRAHFDFVVVDSQAECLFAVEFDGPFHANSRQHELDLSQHD
ncbi:MAG: DUF2726 domain-containing protein [Chloroflexi bacterium]|nr:DUF2726 domain-containing protein [Chloroflexota bacterium]